MFIKLGLILSFVLAITPGAFAFTQVTISTGAPVSLESDFLAATSAQFTSVIVKNPFASNTYTLKLFGKNPSYDPPVTQKNLLDAIVTIDSYTYVYGWISGMEYQNQIAEGLAGSYAIHCSSPSLFYLSQTSSTTFDSKTCGDVLGTFIGSLFNLNLSTPPVLGGFQ